MELSGLRGEAAAAGGSGQFFSLERRGARISVGIVSSSSIKRRVVLLFGSEEEELTDCSC